MIHYKGEREESFFRPRIPQESKVSSNSKKATERVDIDTLNQESCENTELRDILSKSSEVKQI